MTQHEIKKAIPLLDLQGNLTEPGYAKKLLPVYRRADIKAPKLRIKEWDYYLINDGTHAVAMTIDDNGYMGLDSLSFIDLEERWEKTVSPMCAFPMGMRKMPESSAAGDVKASGRNYEMSFRHVGSTRELSFRMENFLDGPAEGHFVLSDEPEESMVIATPFDRQKRFYYNQKINCMRAEGHALVKGRLYEFSPDRAFAVLDWGRGVWTYRNTWYWGSASGLADGVRFGWNIGYGFGNTAAASENMLFYDGRAHKLSQVTFNIPKGPKGFDYMSPWTFTSDDGRFEMDFRPVLDRAACTNALILKSDQHQVFGLFDGKAVLDDGHVIEVKDFPGFAERVENKW